MQSLSGGNRIKDKNLEDEWAKELLIYMCTYLTEKSHKNKFYVEIAPKQRANAFVF